MKTTRIANLRPLSVRDIARAFRVPVRFLQAGGPMPLCIDGHAYRRRTKRRKG